MTPHRRVGLAATVASVATVATIAASGTSALADSLDGGARPSWSLLTSGTSAQLRGLSAVSKSVVWASGTAGTVVLTTDGGKTWSTVSPTGLGTEKSEFRDIEATSATHAVVMAAGEGEASRMLVTDDAGKTWKESYRNKDPKGFYDCMAFTGEKEGVTLGDPIDGKFQLIRTTDAGHSWVPVEAAKLPAAKPGEAAFAASGTCLSAGPTGILYLVTGGVNPARIMTSDDDGATWKAAATPIPGSASAGIFSVAFHCPMMGLLVGGDYLQAAGTKGNASYTIDGGKTWKTPTKAPSGYRSAVAWKAGEKKPTAITVGTDGSDITTDSGKTWHNFDTGSFDAVQCVEGRCWASGPRGRIGVLRMP